MRNLFVGCAVAALATSAVYAQETTSTIQGSVTSESGPVAGATVTITHVPSGTISTTVSKGDGGFSVSGLRPGGPFTVAVNADGYSSAQITDVATVVGQAFSLPVVLDKAGQEIVVSASRVKGARIVSMGPSTVLNANQISKIASVNRDIRDLMQRDPFATLDSSQSTGRQVSFAGVNPRFNRFTIDGVPITDSFGLNPDALPSRRGPVPLDSIGQFETKVAPFDIREGFFQGGVINATLKSGTNDFHGTGFYTFSSDELQGNRTKPYLVGSSGGTDARGKVTVPNYTSKDFGATLSGPIWKDKVFFMISGERVRASTPLTYPNNFNITDASLARVTAAAQSVYGVDTKGIQSNNGDKDDRLVGRLDFNVAPSQRLALTGIYTKDSILTLGSTSTGNLPTGSNDYIKPNRVFAGVAQLNSDWSSTVSTEARVLYKDYKSGQNPLNPNTAGATICSQSADAAGIAAGTFTNTTNAPGVTQNNATSCASNNGSILVGPPGSAQANVLRVKTFEASLVTRFTFGNHRVRLLLDGQNSDNYNLFVNGARGTYYFDTIDAFERGIAQTVSYTNATTGNQNDAAARFSYQTYTFGLQDDWKVSPQLTVSYGARYDMFAGSTFPLVNNNFIAREGFSNTYYINGKGLFQPRFGIDYTPTPRLNFHGGGGIFGGGTPDVYVGNSFSASGVQPATVTQNTSTLCAANLRGVSLTNLPAGCVAALGNASATSAGAVSALAKNFKVPSLWRATLSTTYKADFGRLGDGWVFGGDVLFSKTRDALLYQDLRNRPITGTSALTPDGRQRYFDVVCNNNTTACSDTQGDYVLGNTSKGRSWVFVARMNKHWDFGIDVGASFTYQNAKDQQALTSSVASSNYGNGAYFDPNGGAYGHSNDEVRYSFKYNVSFEHSFFQDYKTRLDIFGQTRIGSPYSYTFQDGSCCNSARSTVFGTVGSNSRYLFYVPTVNDPKVIYADAATQTAIENLINSSGLSKYRGKVAPRNAFNSKWFTKIDLHLEQEIPTFVGRSRISVFADVENFLNILNHDWGQTLRSSFPYSKSVAQVACVASGGNSCAQYRYSGATTQQNLADQLVLFNGSSLYTVRVGARFTF
ncbi:TonB-dependent receptor plug domain-containing protein [Sphingomonas sp. AP4-R1]|uniref:TonB-dependent receptor n=1 Tax=Sphingomonas sp. AP4-R1 TaxID=2735134 RepID=UPI001493A35F|nr:carboxypeptidase regulatory-like domain-containing protein [Sphingomonas sp. AP4-R1]QJU59446.1 TonB-dependent receptor plug domain-containing protein [Sphingomonas sp. AP4-R1]